jgi:uncharacterized protein (DUF2062 family)
MATRSATLWQRMVAWCRRNMPTRESMESNRLLRPVAHRVLAPELWRFTRRSVPRGVVLGTIVGFLAPVAQTPIAALVALPFRANVPVAALTTFITNPLTTPLIWAAAIFLGRWVLHVDAVVPGQPVRDAATSGWLHWLAADVGPPLVVGLLLLTTIASIIGYALSVFGWRWWIAHKWRTRRHAEP